LIGTEAVVDSGEGCSVAELRERLRGHYPAAEALIRRSRACVADRLVDDDRRVGPEENVEFLPPVSGG
jgi:molybdopterin converting factor small subunit